MSKTWQTRLISFSRTDDKNNKIDIERVRAGDISPTFCVPFAAQALARASIARSPVAVAGLTTVAGLHRISIVTVVASGKLRALSSHRFYCFHLDNLHLAMIPRVSPGALGANVIARLLLVLGEKVQLAAGRKVVLLVL